MSNSSRLRLPAFRLGWQAIVLTASKIGILLMHLRFSGSLLLLAGFALYCFTFPERMAEQQLLQANAELIRHSGTRQSPILCLQPKSPSKLPCCFLLGTALDA